MKKISKRCENIKRSIIDREWIFPNPNQPRQDFSERKLEELAQSIKENGLLEPIVVTPRGDRFMIVAGERRFRACGIAEFKKVPVRVIEADTYNKLRALVNNLLAPPPSQEFLCQGMSEDEAAVGLRYDRMIEQLVGLERSSFSPKDLKILPRVVTSSLDVNIEQLDLIAGELLKIKKALIQAQAARDAAGKEAA
jgi:hypothetical protein